MLGSRAVQKSFGGKYHRVSNTTAHGVYVTPCGHSISNPTDVTSWDWVLMNDGVAGLACRTCKRRG